MAVKEQFLGTGRRKKSVARVRLQAGKGNFVINKKDINEYFGYETLKMILKTKSKVFLKLYRLQYVLMKYLIMTALKWNLITVTTNAILMRNAV